MIKKIYITFILLLIITGYLYPQSNLEIQFNRAVKLFNQEEYYDAITEFKRLNFFDRKNQFAFQANYFIGLSYKYGAKLSDAVQYFNIAEINAKTDDEIFKAKTQIIRTNILRRTNERANQLLDELSGDTRFTNRSDQINYWRGWNFIFMDKWNEAAKIFSRIDSCKELYKLSLKVDDDRYSETLAKVLSVFIPGAGQIYTGNYISGILSLGWNTLFGYLTVHAFVDDRVFDGLMIANFLWLRFYRGNLENAGKFVEEKNTAISNKSLLYLQNNYKGLKP